MEPVDIKEMLRLNHLLSQKHFWVKFRRETDYDVYIVPINKEYNPARNGRMFELITEYYDRLGLDVMIDETMMRYNLYKRA